MLCVIDARATGQQGKAEQKIGERVAAYLREGRKLDQAARLHVAESILLHEANVGAKLEQMFAARVGRCVDNLEGVGHAVLRVIAFVAERRESRHGNKTQAKVARIR